MYSVVRLCKGMQILDYFNMLAQVNKTSPLPRIIPLIIRRKNSLNLKTGIFNWTMKNQSITNIKFICNCHFKMKLLANRMRKQIDI